MKNLIFAVITMLIIFACSDKNPVENEGDENIVVTDSSVTVTVTNPEEETVIKFKDNTITIPAGATEEGSEITVSLLSTSLINFGLTLPEIKIESTELIMDSIIVRCPDLDVTIPTTAIVKYEGNKYTIQNTKKELGEISFTFSPALGESFKKTSGPNEWWLFICALPNLYQEPELIGDVGDVEDEKVLILIHGITADTEKWTTQTLTGKTFYEEMQEIYGDRILMYQYPSGLAIDVNILGLSSLLNEKIDEDVKIDIVGHSMGGLIGRKFNLLYPEKVDKFISLGSPFNGAYVEYGYVERVVHEDFLSGIYLRWFTSILTQGAQDLTFNSPFVKDLNTIGGTTSCKYLNIIGTDGREEWVQNDSIVFATSADMLDYGFPQTCESPDELTSEKFFLTHTKIPLGGTDLINTIKEFLNEPTNQAPSKVVTSDPANGETDVPVNKTFDWVTVTDPDGDPVTYDLLLGTQQPLERIAQDLTETSFTPENPLDYETTYYYQIISKDNHGNTTESDVWWFTTASDSINHTFSTFTDSRDSKVYKTVRYTFDDGTTQEWFAENLDYAHTSSRYYNDDETTYKEYGRLYQHRYAQESCPSGWRLPTKKEIDKLIDGYGGYEIAGGKLKEIGTSHWNNPNTGATNESGFFGRGAGIYDLEIIPYDHWVFKRINEITQIWVDKNNYYYGLNNKHSRVAKGYFSGGYSSRYVSVRPIKDQ